MFVPPFLLIKYATDVNFQVRKCHSYALYIHGVLTIQYHSFMHGVCVRTPAKQCFINLLAAVLF